MTLRALPWRECCRSSWGGRTRTCNFLINSQAVCQLTYTPSKNKNAHQAGLVSASNCVPRHVRANQLSRWDSDYSRSFG